MNLDELERLAKAATQRDALEPNAYRQAALMEANRKNLKAAIHPDVILRLIAVVRAADAMRAEAYGPSRAIRDFDAARAQLEQQP